MSEDHWYWKGIEVERLAEEVGGVDRAIGQLINDRGGSLSTWRRDRQVALHAEGLRRRFPNLPEPHLWRITSNAAGLLYRLSLYLPEETMTGLLTKAIEGLLGTKDLASMWNDVRRKQAEGTVHIRRGKTPNSLKYVKNKTVSGYEFEVINILKKNLLDVIGENDFAKCFCPVDSEFDFVVVRSLYNNIYIEILEIKKNITKDTIKRLESCLIRHNSARGWIVIQEDSEGKMPEVTYSNIGILKVSLEEGRVTLVKSAQLKLEQTVPFPWANVIGGLVLPG